MILIDFRQIANLVFYSGYDNVGYELKPFKHHFLSYVLSMKARFTNKYGDLVIAFDSKNYWRKSEFKHYKASRAAGREASDLDWKKIYANFDSLEQDLRNYMPWKMVAVERAEADDIIGVLAGRFHTQEPIMIVSADNDFLQLQKYKGVAQYSPLMKKLLVESNPQIALRDKIIRGDKGDGIPNIKSVSDTFVNKGRQKSITKEWLEPIIKMPNIEEFFTEDEKKRYEENRKLIDFDYIPKDIVENIVNTYKEYIPAKRSGIVSYLNEQEFPNLFEMLNVF